MKTYGNSIKLNEICDNQGNIINNNWIKINETTFKRYYNTFVKCRNRTKKQFLCYIKTVCSDCGANFLISKQNFIKNKNRIFLCSHECKTRYLTKDQNILDYNTTLEYFYLIGLISTDGCCSKKIYRISIKLQANDKILVMSLQKRFGGKLSIQYSKNKNHQDQYLWSVINKESWEYLNSIGITPAKSLTLDIDKWFQTLTYEQKCCFVRGCIDGDGWVGTNKHKTSYIGFCSASFKFINTIFNFIINDILKNKFNTDSIIKILKSSTCYRFAFTKKSQIKLILSELYNSSLNCSLYLHRKYDKAKEILNTL